MAREVTWGRSALEDLHQAALYLARGSQHYAQALIDKAAAAAETLLDFPKLGRRVPEVDDENTRELFVQSYRLIYELRLESIHVIAFVHGARDLAALWEREGTSRQSEESAPGDTT